jgi:hypothetical protein
MTTTTYDRNQLSSLSLKRFLLLETGLLLLALIVNVWGSWPLEGPAPVSADADHAKPSGGLRALSKPLAPLGSKADDGLVLAAKSVSPALPSDRLEELNPVPVEARWIDVDLSEQVLTAYEGNTPVRTVPVSTGLPATPTPVGQFRIWVKFEADDMEGPGYYLPDVPYVMYFHMGYGLHGVYWHANFGQPMSHGCVNMPTPEAEWLFHWAEVGTLVNIHE